MNHPARIFTYFGKPGKKGNDDFNALFQENLNSSVSLGINDNRFDWILRLK